MYLMSSAEIVTIQTITHHRGTIISMTDVTAFITAGGKSTRMGEDKAWLRLGGRSMIERVIGALKPITNNLAIIANDAEYRVLGLPVFSDEHFGIGPLEAIRTALANAQTRWII